MDIKDSYVLGGVPEYLVKAKEDLRGLEELLEKVEPNTVVLVAGLMDKILSELQRFNHWDDYATYIKEFRLPEVFEGLEEGFYDVSNPELLEGLFAFKGTSLDVQYILKVAGLNMEIYDKDYYRRNTSIALLMEGKYSPAFDNIIAQADLDKLDQLFDTSPNLVIGVGDAQASDYTGTYVDKVYNDQDLKVDNTAGNKVFGFSLNTVSSTEAIDLGNLLLIVENQLNISFSEEQRDLLPYLVQDYLSAREAILNGDLDCSLTAEINVDLDSPDFDGFRSSAIKERIREVVATRISVCVYLRLILLSLSTKTNYNPKEKVSEPSELLIDKTVVDQMNTNPPLSVDNLTPFTVDNILPALIPGMTSSSYLSDSLDIQNEKEFVTPVYVTNKRSNYIQRVNNNLGRVVNNNDPYKVWGSNLAISNKIAKYLPLVNNTANLKVNNNEPYKVPGFSEFKGGKDGTLPEGVFDGYLKVETIWDFGDTIPPTQEGFEFYQELDNIAFYSTQNMSSELSVEAENDFSDNVQNPDEDFLVEIESEVINGAYLDTISVGESDVLVNDTMKAEALVGGSEDGALTLTGFI